MADHIRASSRDLATTTSPPQASLEEPLATSLYFFPNVSVTVLITSPELTYFHWPRHTSLADIYFILRRVVNSDVDEDGNAVDPSLKCVYDILEGRRRAGLVDFDILGPQRDQPRPEVETKVEEEDDRIDPHDGRNRARGRGMIFLALPAPPVLTYTRSVLSPSLEPMLAHRGPLSRVRASSLPSASIAIPDPVILSAGPQVSLSTENPRIEEEEEVRERFENAIHTTAGVQDGDFEVGSFVDSEDDLREGTERWVGIGDFVNAVEGGDDHGNVGGEDDWDNDGTISHMGITTHGEEAMGARDPTLPPSTIHSLPTATLPAPTPTRTFHPGTSSRSIGSANNEGGHPRGDGCEAWTTGRLDPRRDRCTFCGLRFVEAENSWDYDLSSNEGPGGIGGVVNCYGRVGVGRSNQRDEYWDDSD